MLTTSRLILRRWQPEDREPFAAMNADAEVMRYFPKLLDRVESDVLAERIDNHFAVHGFGAWAVGMRDAEPFVGFVGLMRPNFEAHFTPAVEVGWRLCRTAWGRGIATEAAAAALRYGFETLELREIVSFTVPANTRSLGVMQRLGMRRDPHGDFEHPRLPEGHAFRPHVLYRLARKAWSAAR